MKRKLLFFGLLILFVCNVAAQNFNDYFQDKTLRIDYSFSGDVNHQQIAVDELFEEPHWYGKRNRLSEVPVKGDGQIQVRSHRTHQLIYLNSFSTLFQEWLNETDEAKHTVKSFENVFLVPMPKDTVDITVVLYDNAQKPMVQLTHTVVPQDILIHKIGQSFVTPHKQLLEPADSNKCIHIAFVAEGYREQEMPLFLSDAQATMNAIFSHEPFKSMKDRFSIVAVESPSLESGTSEPGKGIWKNTALHSHFDTFYSERYLTTLNLKDMHNLLAGIPYEHIIVLVNSTRYGGGGILNSYDLSTMHHAKSMPVVVHEFGHSFAGLADEYAYEEEAFPRYPHDVEPWEPNITTLVDFKSKWADMVSPKTKIPTQGTKNNVVGCYEGAGYSVKGVYRPCYDCRMRTNENPTFCPVCQRAIKRLIDFYTK